jgi:hypothetical protein
VCGNVAQNLGRFGKYIRNAFQFLKCVVAKGWRRSVRPIVWKESHRVKEEINIFHSIKRKKAKWTGRILRWNCFLKDVVEGKVEGRKKVTRRRGRRRKELLNELKETERC